MLNKLEITLPSDREIVVTRSFDAPRDLVWDCHTKPALVRRWLLGPPGWEMPVCEIDLRVDGKYRYEWIDKGRGKTMGMGGVFIAVKMPERFDSKEKFDDDWTGGETVTCKCSLKPVARRSRSSLSSTPRSRPATAQWSVA